ncbi:MAG: hypothetical protein R2867_07300 [Caldilineaceae bacterium]
MAISIPITIAEPTKPVVQTVIRLASRITGIAADNNALYVVSNEGLHRLDISDPTEPHPIELIQDNYLSYGPLIAEGYLYYGGQSELWIKEIASSTAPRALIPDTILGLPLDVAVLNGVAYVANGFHGITALGYYWSDHGRRYRRLSHRWLGKVRGYS